MGAQRHVAGGGPRTSGEGQVMNAGKVPSGPPQAGGDWLKSLKTDYNA